jgi:corrinoid protein of di/trimethylamine methyltransferase
MADIYESVAEQLIAGNVDEVVRLTKEGLDKGSSPEDILDKGLLAGMEVVSERFKEFDIFIPDVLRSAKAMQGAMDVIRPLLTESGERTTSTMVIGTVKGDMHDIGKNLVGLLFEGAGFQVVDLGVDQGPESFMAAVKEHNPDILGMSALLTTTMPVMEETIKALQEAGIRDQLRIMVGGSPVTEEFAQEIGADAYAANAASAVEKGKELVR